MKKWPLLVGVFAASCASNASVDQVVSQTFVHKYGFNLTPEEWKERSEEGQVISHLQNGVTITQSFQEGILHGPCTYTFPHSAQIETIQIYDHGTLLKETVHNEQGQPLVQKAYECDQHMMLTKWGEQGVPLSLEEYDGETLVDGKYYTIEHELEAKVEAGYGERIKRDRNGQLLARDTIEEGQLVCRVNYHPNQSIHSISHYRNNQLHGEQTTFTPSGRPLVKLCWNSGELDGQKVLYRNGSKIAEIPYAMGIRSGLECHYDDLGSLTAEIEWKDDQRHGRTRLYAENVLDKEEWFFHDQEVSAERFAQLKVRELLIAEMEDSSPDEIIR